MEKINPTTKISNLTELLHHLNQLRDQQKRYFASRSVLHLENSKLLERQLDEFLRLNNPFNQLPISQQREIKNIEIYHGSAKGETHLEFWNEHTNG